MQSHSFSICRRHKQLEGNSTLVDDGSKPSVGTGYVIAGTTTTSGRVDFKSASDGNCLVPSVDGIMQQLYEMFWSSLHAGCLEMNFS